MLKMKHSQFVVWHFIDTTVYVLAVGATNRRTRSRPGSWTGAVWARWWQG
ncbi:MAG TPA: hypothetical protein VE864_12215 [Streptosporangiaceae bacterium]|nr:hypothetical protein [Streptosporangiaceae bacterium]